MITSGVLQCDSHPHFDNTGTGNAGQRSDAYIRPRPYWHHTYSFRILHHMYNTYKSHNYLSEWSLPFFLFLPYNSVFSLFSQTFLLIIAQKEHHRNFFIDSKKRLKQVWISSTSSRRLFIGFAFCYFRKRTFLWKVLLTFFIFLHFPTLR